MLNVRILSEGWLNDGWLAAYDACVCMNGGTVLAPVCPTMSDGFPLNSFLASNCTRDAEKWKKRESKIHSSTASSCHEIEYGEERRRRFVPFWNWGEKISTFPFFAMIVCRDRKSSYLFKWHDDDISRSFAKTQYILLTCICMYSRGSLRCEIAFLSATQKQSTVSAHYNETTPCSPQKLPALWPLT